MQQISPHPLEARLNGHRKLFIALTAFIAESSEGRAFLDRLARETETVVDHEEDPGIVPDDGFALQAGADEEMRSIVKAALSRSQALDARAEQQGPGGV